MNSATDKETPAIFLGGAQNSTITTLKYGTADPVTIGDDIYFHMTYNSIHVYCVISLYGTDKDREFDAAWDKLPAKTRQEIKNRTEQYIPETKPPAPTFPKTLFHYTSIKNLALILKNQTIRFKRLDQVNDPEEAKAPDLPHANTAVFSSSWTAETRELLPLWKFYGDNMEGVRIELPINFFKGSAKPRHQEGDDSYQPIAGEIAIEREGLNPKKAYHVNGPGKVRYSDSDIDKLRPCFENIEDDTYFSLSHLGMTKPSCWKFEKEWRYRILALQTKASFDKNSKNDPLFNLQSHPVIDEYKDIPISETALNKIRITLGPLAKGNSSAQRVLVENLLKEFAPGGEVVDSIIEFRRT